MDLLAKREYGCSSNRCARTGHETYGGEGVPDWAMKRQLRSTCCRRLPYRSHWLLDPETSTVFDEFWANKYGLLDRLGGSLEGGSATLA